MSDLFNPAGQEQPESAQENQRILDLLPAFALGATDPDENAALLRALATDEAAARELGSYVELANALLFSAPPAVPSPALAANLRAALDAPALRIAPAGMTAAVAPAAVNASTPAAPVRPGRQWHWPRWAAVAAILLLLLLNVYWVRELVGLRGAQTALQQQLADQVAQQAALQQQLSNQKQLLAGLVSNEVERYVMAAAQPDSPAQAQVAWLPGSDLAVLTAKQFPTLEPGKAYQLWLIRDGKRTSGGLFTVSASGDGSLIFAPPAPLESFEGMGITPEPEGGSPGPTAPPVVTARL